VTKINKIGNITLEYPLFIKEEFATRNVKAKTFETLGGGLIVYERVKRENANYITLISKDSGWVDKTTLKSIYTLGDALEVEITLYSTDGESYKVRFAHEVGDFLSVEDVIHEDGEWFKVEINFCSV